MSNSLNFPLDRLIHSVATGPDAITGLNAMADELGGRRGRSLIELAERVQRGTIEQKATSETVSRLPQNSISTLQAAERLPRWFMLEDRRKQARSRMQMVVWFGLLYLLSAALIGRALFWVVEPLSPDVAESFSNSWTHKKLQLESLGPIKIAYQVIVVGCLVAIAIWGFHSLRQRWRYACLPLISIGYGIEWMINCLPWIGSTWRAIELAKISETIHQSLASEWTYPEALRAAAVQTDSVILQGWLTAGAERLENGAFFQDVMQSCPLSARWLRGISELLTARPTVGSSLIAQWEWASDYLHQEIVRRSTRLAVTVAPLAVLCSAGLAVLGWVCVFKMIFQTIQFLTY